MKRFAPFLLILLILIQIIVPAHAITEGYDYSHEQSLRREATVSGNWILYDQLGARTRNYYQCSYTSNHLYFSYSEACCVDVYDHNGTFLYTFLLPDSQNGCVSVRCIDDTVFIGAKNHTVYILEGTTEVNRLTPEEANFLGYDFSWFTEASTEMVVTSQTITVMADGHAVYIPTPQIIQNSIPPKSSPFILPFFFALFLFILTYCIYNSRYNKEQP